MLRGFFVRVDFVERPRPVTVILPTRSGPAASRASPERTPQVADWRSTSTGDRGETGFVPPMARIGAVFAPATATSGVVDVLSEPRTIGLLTDLIHIPSKHQPDRLREIYNKLCTTCDYENFIRTADGARVESGQLETDHVSKVTFRQDRIQIVEDHPSMSLDQCIRKIVTVARVAMEELRLPVYLAQQSTVRSIAAPNCFRSAGEFLAVGIFRMNPADLEPLGRPTSLHGLRLLFPPTKERLHKFNVRVECYLRDPRSIYIENVATFQAPIQLASLDLIGTHLEAAAQFVSSNICEFLSRFDRKDPLP